MSSCAHRPSLTPEDRLERVLGSGYLCRCVCVSPPLCSAILKTSLAGETARPGPACSYEIAKQGTNRSEPCLPHLPRTQEQHSSALVIQGLVPPLLPKAHPNCSKSPVLNHSPCPACFSHGNPNKGCGLRLPLPPDPSASPGGPAWGGLACLPSLGPTTITALVFLSLCSVPLAAAPTS